MAVVILGKHISYGDKGVPELKLFGNLLIVSFLLGLLNAFVRPILMLIALPLLIFTLGLFTFVINALLLSLLTWLLPFFHITNDSGSFSFFYAFLAALIIWVIAGALNVLIVGKAHRRNPPVPPRNPGGGDGPVIDV